MTIATLIVDDEAPAREGIKLRLLAHPEFQILGECASGTEAVKAISSFHPDIVFLDIHMPDMNGFEVVQSITVEPTPIIVFITAYDQHALRAFEYHALDYLLKPIDDERFTTMLRFVAGEVRHRNYDKYAHDLKSMVTEYLSTTDAPHRDGEQAPEVSRAQFLSRLMIRAKGEIAILPVGEIDWLESADDYVYVHSHSRKHLFRETLASLENQLDPRIFVRIHRSAMVNVGRVRGLRPNEHGDCDVFLLDGTKLKLSRNYRERLEEMLRYSL